MDKLEFLSTGLCQGCQDCADNYGITVEELGAAIDAGLEEDGHFSWSDCELCGAIAGTRYTAHGKIDGELVHLNVCADCVMRIGG